MKRGGLFAFFKPTPAKAAGKHAPESSPEVKGNATAAQPFKRKAEPQASDAAFAAFAARSAPLARASSSASDEVSTTPQPSAAARNDSGGGGSSSSSGGGGGPSPSKKPKTAVAPMAAPHPVVSTKRSPFGFGSAKPSSATPKVPASTKQAAPAAASAKASANLFTSAKATSTQPKRKMGSGAKDKKKTPKKEKKEKKAEVLDDDDDDDDEPVRVRGTKSRARLKRGSTAAANKRRVMDTSDEDSDGDAAMASEEEEEESEFSGDEESSEEEEDDESAAPSSSEEEEAESSDDEYAAKKKKKKTAAAAARKKAAVAVRAPAPKAAAPAKTFGMFSGGGAAAKGAAAATSGGGGGGGGGGLAQQAAPGCRLMGEHDHDKLPWLQPGCRRDANGTLEGEPGYDGRTLRVPAAFLDKASPAQQQWWAIKALNFDTVLFFKVGKFYEMFNTDADVGVRHLDLTYMKGDNAHAGFPELAYGKHAERLVAMGFKVGRVEQTETPEMFSARKGKGLAKPKTTQGHGGAWKDKSGSVSRREIVSMLSAGTRTHCFMDMDGTSDASSKFEGAGCRNALGQGWLLTLAEFPLAAAADGSAAAASGVQSVSNRATRVYGAVLLDAATGAFRFAQFEDCAQSTQLRTLLALFPVVELVVCGGAAGGADDEAGAGLAPSTVAVLKHFLPRPWECHTALPHGRATHAPGGDTLHKDAHKDAFAPGAALGGFRAPSDGTRVPMAAFFPADGAAGAAAMLRSARGAYFRDDTGAPTAEAQWPPLLRALLRAAGDAPAPAADDEAPFLAHGVGRWDACLAALGGCLQHLARFLLDQELFSHANFALYTPKVQAAAIMEQAAEQAAAASSSPSSREMEVDTGAAAAAGGSDGALLQAVHMVLDNAALANLEVLQNQHDGSRRGTLLEFMDKCQTPFGKRLFRSWLAAPLCDLKRIAHRTDAVAALATATNTGSLDTIRAALRKLPDLPRLLQVVHTVGNHYKATDHPAARAVLYENDKYNMRKVKALCEALAGFEEANKLVKNMLRPMLREDGGALASSALLRELLLYPEVEAVDRLDDGAAPAPARRHGWGSAAAVNADGAGFPDFSVELKYFQKAFKKDQAMKTGTLTPRPGYSPAYDEAIAAEKDATAALERYKTEQECVLGCRGLKWFGKNKDRHQLEVPLDVIRKQPGGSEPAEYQLKTQTKAVKRFWTPEIQELLADLLEAEAAREAALSDQMRAVFHTFDSSYDKWAAATEALAQLDALASLGGVSCYEGYVRATFDEKGSNGGPTFASVRGRHPTVEAALKGDFIPNGTTLGAPDGAAADGAGGAPLLLLSGPNMGGKSTLLRQNCILAIMAQMGCFVPADSLRLTPVDRIFTRLGASDRILQGQSTFFVELAETATILHEATDDSLVILDELGRGTSTFDGTAIADAVVRHVASRLRCRTMFATHYHSLVEDYGADPRVQLGHMACIADPTKQSEADTDVTFLYELQPGPCSKSYGVNVARLARLPAAVVALAAQKSEEFARSSQAGPSKGGVRALAQRGAQLCDADTDADAAGVLEQLKAIQAEAKSTLGM